MKTTRKNLSLTLCIICIICTGLLLYKRFFIETKCGSLNPNLSTNFKSALLIGLKWEPDKSTTCYRSIWITPDKDKLKISNEINFIVVPRNDEMWKLEPIRYNFENSTDYLEYILAHPLNSSFNPQTFQYENATYKHKLNFVNGNLAAVTSYSTHKSNNKLITNRNCSIINLSDLNTYKDFSNKLRFYEIFGKDSLDIINKYKNKKIKDRDYVIDTTTGDNWCIGHKDGKWIPLIAKTLKSLKNDNTYILYNTELQLPKETVPHNKLPIHFSTIKKLIPETIDAISSPSEDILAVFTENKLKIYSYSANTIGKEILTIDLKPGERMIMEEWADGSKINNWNESLKSIK